MNILRKTLRIIKWPWRKVRRLYWDTMLKHWGCKMYMDGKFIGHYLQSLNIDYNTEQKEEPKIEPESKPEEHSFTVEGLTLDNDLFDPFEDLTPQFYTARICCEKDNEGGE